MILVVECPECGHKWDVTDDTVRQPARGVTVVIRCPSCKKEYKAGAMRAHGFIVQKRKGNR